MRNPSLPVFKSGMSKVSERSQHATRALHRKLVGFISRAILGVAALAFPVSLIIMANGFPAPLLLSVTALAVASFALVKTQRGRTNTAINIQLFYIFGSGLALTIVDPAVIDFGLAQLILGGIHAILLFKRESKNALLILSAGAALFVVASAASIHTMLMGMATPIVLAGAVSCAVIAGVQAYSAYQLYHSGDLRDRSHNNAIRHLVDHMGDGYVRFSGDGQVVFASSATENLFGAPRYELTGQGFGERVHILDRPAFLRGFSEAVHRGNTKTVEMRIRKDDLERRANIPQFVWVEVFFSPVKDTEIDKSDWEVVALLRNITRRKSHELEMSSAREAAEQASKTKSRFLATIGHELRTPLNAIVGFSEMMSNGIGGELQPTHQEYAGIIQQSGHHLLDVVNMLLDMSRIDAGKFELHLAEFKPADLVDPCLAIVEASARERNIKLVANLPKTLPSITGDERACRQILINLLSNAVKFSTKGGEVRLRIKRQGQKLVLSVSDKGIGMSPKVTARVGEAFFQAHEDLNRQYEGTGLGLSIVKGLVELHQGTMRIQSTVGKGTTVTVLLPVHGPEIQTVNTEIVTNLRQKSRNTETIPWPEQKSVAQ